VNLPFFIARRYFGSRKKKHFIQVISIISMLVVGTSTMALVIVLSVFNGLEGLLRGLYNSFDPDLTVVTVQGKSFELDEKKLAEIRKIPGVVSLAEVIEDNVLLKYQGVQRVVRMRGYSEDFEKRSRFDQAITFGHMKLVKDTIAYAILGRGIFNELNINLNDDFHPLVVYYPKNIAPNQLNPTNLFAVNQILPGGTFSLEKYYDDNFMFVPISFAEDLMQYHGKRTSLEIGVKKPSQIQGVRAQIESLLGPDYSLKAEMELHGDLYKILRIEKIFLFLVLGLIIIIGSVNIYFSLSMLVIDKQKDLGILRAMGAAPDLLRKIFISEGILIAFSGAFSGLVLGVLICLGQQKFGWVGMGVQGAISPAYPVALKFSDLAAIVVFIIVVTLLAAIQPARKAAHSTFLHPQG
jgi:lipoprotein-releasing system permease protein